MYAIPNQKYLVDKKPAALGAVMEKVGGSVEKSFKFKKFDPKSQYIKFVVAGFATYLPNISSVAMEVAFLLRYLPTFCMLGLPLRWRQCNY